MTYKLGSLFDGSGGFPLAGVLCGIEPVWAAEVEPYPIAVTSSRFPNMKHLGDISKVNGADIEPVDIITFGSPCQDLSVAGKRAGLKHEANGDEETTRSGLFMEAVRIIKEMRKATNGNYPKMCLWENVPGAFSSNRGEDFRVVCEELIKIVEPSAFMPPVPKNGWNYADSYIGDGWSLAYRVLDAQYWGVPQRRRRIYLVADFRGTSAREVLFERQGVRGYFETSRTSWEGTPADAQGSTGANDREGKNPGGDRGRLLDAVGADVYNLAITGKVVGRLTAGGYGSTGTSPKIIERGRQISVRTDGKAPTLRAETHGNVPCAVYSIENHPADSRVNLDESGKAPTLTAAAGMSGNNQPIICLQGNGIDRADTAGCNGKGWNDETCYTLNTIDRPAVVYAVDQGGGGKSGANVSENTAPTLCTTHGGEPAVAYGLDRASFNQGQNAKFDFSISEEQQPTLTARGPGAVAHLANGDSKTGTLCAEVARRGFHGTQEILSGAYHIVEQYPRYIVRRLTPTECARLQGFADWWGIVEPKDTLTDEEYHFWLDVRNTHAVINGRETKEYTLKAMLTWYNKLYTDSAEYKMWGNGIALPTALYCMQGVVDALNTEEEDDEDWML